MSKTLVAYFSASGVTKRTAEQLADILGGDAVEIKPLKKYTNDDLDWTNQKSRSTVEMRDVSSRPELAEVADVADYDEILIGFPIWWYTAPHIVNSYLESADFSGKKVWLYATSGGSGIDKSLSDMQKLYPNIDWQSAKLLNGRLNAEQIQKWIRG